MSNTEATEESQARKQVDRWEIRFLNGGFFLYNYDTEVGEIYDPELGSYIVELLNSVSNP